MTRSSLSPRERAAVEDGVGKLRSKVAIVTGAPRSIGRAIAESLATEGAQVVVHYRRA
jgi:NADP-dependent 3-hydroxy acid dehydrogenase YdfG